MKKVVIIGIIMLVLVGCTNKKEKPVNLAKELPIDIVEEEKLDVVVCEITEGDNTLTDTMTGFQNRMKTSTIESVMDYSKDIERGKITETDIKNNMEDTKKDYSGIEGVSYEYNIEGTIVTETLITDYTKASMKQLYFEGMVDTKESEYISMDRTIESYIDDGMRCKAIDE